jgi:hypothetical protein
MQESPLLEQLDRCFISLAWTSSFPNTLLIPMAKPLSDHIPCNAQIGTKIPKSQVFRFENFWMQHPGFMEIVQEAWGIQVQSGNATSRIAAKLKNLRRALKHCRGISKISNLIKRCNELILILDKLEEQRQLYTQEANLRIIIKNHVNRLMKYKNDYWRQRYTVRWVHFGDEPTKLFHAAATERYRLNTITSIQDEEGRELFEHEKAAVLWSTFRSQMGHTSSPKVLFN